VPPTGDLESFVCEAPNNGAIQSRVPIFVPTPRIEALLAIASPGGRPGSLWKLATSRSAAQSFVPMLNI
jgi:hypothetical protein